jgi:predicted PurR-regulated permease PerM
MPATAGTNPAEDNRDEPSDDIKYTPKWLRVSAGWGWRLLVVVAVVVLLWQAGSLLSQLTVPLLLAVLLTSGLQQMTNWLETHRLPRWLAAVLALLVLVLVLVGLLGLVSAQIAAQWTQLTAAAGEGFRALLEWLGTGPLRISDEQVQAWLDQAAQYISNSTQEIAAWAATAGTRVGSFFAGLATCLFAAFFFLKDGRRISGAFEKVLPDYTLKTIEPAVRGGWTSLSSYVRAAVIVGVGAGLGALILGSNLWLAITAFTFVCSFIPLLGATIAGAVATIVVLVTLGPVKAVIMLGIFIAVMSIEANVLQPLLLGRAVEIHPLLILLGISAGAIVAGIAGALFAIPLVAFVTGCIRGAEGVFASDDVGTRRVNLPTWVPHGGEGDTPERSGSWFKLPRSPSRFGS